MTQTLFLSTVSSEFGMLRRRLANLTQRTKKCQVRHQDDFFHRGVKTLQKLYEEIQESDLVLHFIGAEAGWCVPQDQAIAFLEHHSEFAEQFPDVAQQGRKGELPATQWEAWLGLLLGKRLCSFQLQTASMDPRQATHLERLNQREQHPDKADDLDALFDEVIGSLIMLDVFTQEDIRRPIQLPYPSIGTLFKGRDDFIQQLRESLQSSNDGRATAITGKAVHGLGGVGKTRLAVEYAWQHAEQYTAVLCVTADSPENMRRNLAELTGPLVMDLAEYSATEEEARVGAALRWLQDHPGWFLILDNVDTEEAVVAVEKLLADLRGGQVLITSRLSRFSDVVEPLELDVMSPEDGATFLLEKTQPKAQAGGRRGRRQTDSDEAAALELASELDGLALALEQAGAYIVQLRHSFAEYLTLWRSHKASVQEWLNTTIQYAGPTDGPLRSVAVTWQTTIDQLGDRERELLNLLAWFAPDPVPLSILAPITESESESPNHPVWSAEEFRAALSNLADFSMLAWDAEADTVTVHRVVQEILRTRQPEPLENLQRVLQLLRTALPDGHSADVHTWSAWEPLRTHVAFTSSEADSRNIDEPTSHLMGELGILLSGKALHREAEDLKRRALAIDERHFGADSTQAAARLNNLATTLKATNRLVEAEPLMRRALSIDESSYGPEHPNVAIHLNNLASLLKATNRLVEAEPLMRRALSINESSYGETHPNVATALNNLGLLLQATNRLVEAEPLMRRALSIDESSYGPQHPNVAIRLNNLALLLQATNRLVEAEPLMERVVSIFEISYGENHPNVATALNNLAQLLKATNRLVEAEPLMRRALSIDESSYGPEHPNVATDLNNLAALLQVTNRLDEAEPISWRVVEIFLAFGKTTGHQHPHTQVAMQNYRLLLQEMGHSEDQATAMIESKLRGVS